MNSWRYKLADIWQLSTRDLKRSSASVTLARLAVALGVFQVCFCLFLKTGVDTARTKFRYDYPDLHLVQVQKRSWGNASGLAPQTIRTVLDGIQVDIHPIASLSLPMTPMGDSDKIRDSVFLVAGMSPTDPRWRQSPFNGIYRRFDENPFGIVVTYPVISQTLKSTSAAGQPGRIWYISINREDETQEQIPFHELGAIAKRSKREEQAEVTGSGSVYDAFISTDTLIALLAYHDRSKIGGEPLRLDDGRLVKEWTDRGRETFTHFDMVDVYVPTSESKPDTEHDMLVDKVAQKLRDHGYECFVPLEMMKDIDDVERYVNVALVALLIFGFFSGFCAAFVTLLSMHAQRLAEVVLMRVTGIRSWVLALIRVIQGVRIGLKASFLGVLLCVLAAFWIPQDFVALQGAPLLDPSLVACAIAFGLGVTLPVIASLPFAWRAYKVNPAEYLDAVV